MNYYPFSVAVGAQFEQPVTGATIRYYVATVGASYPAIRIRSNLGADVLLKPGQSVKLRQFARITIDNYDATNTITGILQIGSEDENLTDDRITGDVTVNGSVIVSDGPRIITDAAQSFSLRATLGASVGNFSVIQLLNPTGSGKIVYVNSVRGLDEDSVYGFEISLHNTALSTLLGTGVNKKSGGAASTAQIRTENPAAQPGTLVDFMRSGVQRAQCEAKFTRPYRLDAAKGLCLVSVNSNVTVRAAVDFDEVSA